MFLFLTALDLFLIHRFPQKHNEWLLGSAINNAIWNLVLMGAIWFRIGWARYVLVTIMLMSVVFVYFIEAQLPEINVAGGLILLVGIYAFCHFVCAILLLMAPSIRKLTSIAYV